MDLCLADRMKERSVSSDIRLLGDFTGIYCADAHSDRVRDPLVSTAADLGVYGASRPVVCEECAGLLAYAEQRWATCPKDPKPFCSSCDTHCYRPEMREAMRAVMRHSGPRAMFHGHAIAALKHLAATWKSRRMGSS